MATVLLTPGRLPKALDMARAFAGEGWRVIVAEPFALAPLPALASGSPLDSALCTQY